MSTIAKLCVAAAWMSGTAGFVASAERGGDYPVQPVPFTDVEINDPFWTPRLQTSRDVTIPYALEQCEETGRIGNFAKAAGMQEGKFEGIYFNDSDLYKIIEGAAYTLALAPDRDLEAYVDGIIAKIAGAQRKDGYLYTARTLQGPDYTPPGGTQRWSDISGGHELYCVGHLYEAAVAYFQATGKRALLDVALKNADLICQVFGPGKLTWPPGHQEIEIGLAKLYRVTGKQKYLDMAKFFLDARGNPEGRGRLYGPYSQDHKPVVQQETAVGHAVRAAYMYAGMADIAALAGNPDYIAAIDRIWRDVVGTKLYLTGGIGAAGGHEGFGPAYELPNLVAYCETCASIANVMWNHRLFLMRGEGKYIDVLERTLYNGLLSGIGLDGKRFFYPNPLESDGRHQRSPWFACACCPSNVARFIPSVAGYVYAHRGDALYVNLFVSGTAKIAMADQTVQIQQTTRYPWDGTVDLKVIPEKPGTNIALKIRIPGWARNEVVPSDLYRFREPCDQNPVITCNGQRVDAPVQDGYVTIKRAWKAEDAVRVELPMPVRRVLANENIKDDVGKVALQRGPLVYCVEWPDVKGGHVTNLVLPDDASIATQFRDDLLRGVTTLQGRGLSTRWVEGDDDGKRIEESEVDFTAIPYHVWAHRGQGEMAVWLARTAKAARPLPAPTAASTSRDGVSNGKE